MKSLIFNLFLILLAVSSAGQIAPDKYFVQFTDKNNSPYSIDNPSEFLSERAIERRASQGISVDIYDLPVNPSYLSGVAGTGATLLNPTKWLNGVTIFTDNPDVLEAIDALPYVAGITGYPQEKHQPGRIQHDKEKLFFYHEMYNQGPGNSFKNKAQTGAFDYGMGFNQIQMLNGDVFHEMGYRGQGKVIAVLDAGYFNANSVDAFDSLWMNGQILGTKDFVRGGDIQFDEHQHGTMVLSCMGANSPGQLIGTAPMADYWLLRSEDGGSEYLIEEYNWVSAAEFADSVGADIINSSLGYSQFNDPTQDHTYEDMDGNTTPATKGADMAAKKGILVVNSLGNEGNSSWYYLSAPSDGDSVMGIGAVDANGFYVGFSSHGPSYDGRVKPDVATQGSMVYVVEPMGGGFTFGGGTSFSSPILAGMAACLWQANPAMTNMQIADAIRKSASQYDNPDDMLGYGIPDFVLANNILTVINGPDKQHVSLNLYPNPVRTSFTVSLDQVNANNADIIITDITGREIYTASLMGNEYTVNAKGLEAGVYFVSVSANGRTFTGKFIKR